MTKLFNNSDSNTPAMFRITIQEVIDANWAEWFSEMTLSSATGDDQRPVTVLTGPIVDQAALRGILDKLWNLNLTVISVEHVK